MRDKLLRLVSPLRQKRARGLPQATDDLAEWCRAHGLDSVVITQAQAGVRKAPIPPDAALHPNFAQHLVSQIPERFLVCIPKARLWGTNGLLILPDGSFASQAIYGRSHLEVDPAYSTHLPRLIVHKKGDYFTLVGEFSNSGNYYHWIHDGLLRLHAVQAHLPLGVKYLVPARLRKHQRETLHLLGLRDEQLVPFSGAWAWECERLWFASLPPSGAEVPEAVAWLRRQLSDAAGVEVSDSSRRRRLYLSRGSSHARVVNEEHLAPVLEKHGFETIQPELLSVTAQVRLFAQAEAIVSATSSGLTNLIFAGQETKILEILEPTWAAEKAWVIWTLAETIGQPFWYLMGETVTNPERPERADLSVPVLELERWLEQL